MEHLYFNDQIRFQAICKSWRWNIHAIKSGDQLPWIFAHKYNQHDKVIGTCYLYNPSNKTKHEIKKKLPFASRFEVTNYGWILISKLEENVRWYRPGSLLFFFYNPFTDETIKLSALETHLYIESHRVILSGNPTSRECVIFVVLRDQCWEGWECMKIYTCRPRDTRGTLHYCLKDFRRDILNLDGVLYCASISSIFGGEKI
ncbi:F-box/kelch-repeat protein At1g57790-like [Pistacia vera]|uniref:F-box/kelch-repeat protein At1g57790-like n=1 Tax=Pistacia vera TaxID=55513 RepID=UPI001263A34E|nr:F-box/kelch-repeat protein At1g57790-like [Pistacia vera]